MTTATKKKNAASPKRETKIATVVALLEQKNGAGLDEISAATGRQTHTVRAALTGLKKKGHVIERVPVDGSSRYSITRAATQ